MAFSFRRDARSVSYLIPASVLIASTLLSLTPLPLVGYSVATPAFPLPAIFYWSLMRRERLPLWLCFLCGFITDALLALPLGVEALLFMLMQTVTLRFASRMHTSVGFFWAAFAVVSCAYWVSYWLLLSYLLGMQLPYGAVLQQWMLTSLSYPMLHWVFTKLLAYVPPVR